MGHRLRSYLVLLAKRRPNDAVMLIQDLVGDIWIDTKVGIAL
ncbi:hypothetical protein [Hydrocarboniclastica marina]|nr:hypothetical protein [Hydrocarboniclastica marina]